MLLLLRRLLLLLLLLLLLRLLGSRCARVASGSASSYRGGRVFEAGRLGWSGAALITSGGSPVGGVAVMAGGGGPMNHSTPGVDGSVHCLVVGSEDRCDGSGRSEDPGDIRAATSESVHGRDGTAVDTSG